MGDSIIKIDSKIRDYFDVKDVDIRTYSPLTLAYIGDGIYDLVIRSIIVGRGNTKASKLHMRTSQIVKANAQAQVIEAIEDLLTEEEEEIYKRGRNAKSPTMAKNASMKDYRKATGFEALVGYLYLQDRFERILELTKIGLEKTNFKI
ncbi:Mini-ribonuclease 3 [Lachnobacterium bovis]|jgi:ribonuclease-3 family protein|uniref:Mini-ribonuclease 3 n=1 Tax=Lachnobacterium bovis DSM 14045 TaxID=1122142 RepID=A0A1H3LPI9_9FIRM|nr:ribonuclease III domain-containing protein [Lachnobacterium bovis]MBQ1802515.1 ribonuclease III [Lachnobacterium sp.]SDY66230.1 ribonuclease-3 family protein [Lachnobacterium bovis DSM 14045]